MAMVQVFPTLFVNLLGISFKGEGGNTHFLHGLGVIIHHTSTVDEAKIPLALLVL
jgi:hypothetical protein